MKHYYIHAALQGVLMGFGCVYLFGGVGCIIIAFVMAAWGVRSAIDMSRVSAQDEENE